MTQPLLSSVDETKQEIQLPVYDSKTVQSASEHQSNIINLINFNISLCLTPEYFTSQCGNSETQRVKTMVCIHECPLLVCIHECPLFEF